MKSWFSLLAGVPAFLAWFAYGAAWLLAPHMAIAGMGVPDPIVWAGYAAGSYYVMLLVIGVTISGGFILF